MKVSVCMITYNHEKFIAQAIESVVMQETDFDYELVIGEDCSTDRTREMCIEYQRKYPDKIRLLPCERNLGAMQNFAQTFYSCSGQYVALLEGDDYWTSPHKLRKQADFLDTHPDYAMCFTRTMFVFEDKRHEPQYGPPPEYKDTSTIEDLLRRKEISTCSAMLRNHLFGSFPDWFFSLEIGDWPLFIMNAQHGKIGYINQVMAAYRIHPHGVYSSRSFTENLFRIVKLYKAINRHLSFKYQKIIGEQLARTYLAICLHYLEDKDAGKVRHYALESIKSLPVRAYFSDKGLTAVLLLTRSIIYFVFPISCIAALGRVRRLLFRRLRIS